MQLNQKQGSSTFPNWLIVLFAIGVLGVGVAGILRAITPKPALPKPNTISENYIGGTTKFNKVRFVGEDLSIPSSLNIYFSSSVNIGTNLRQDLIKKYKLQQNQVIKTIMNGPDYSFMFDDDKNQYLMTTNQYYKNIQNSGLVSQDFVVKATEFLNKIFPNHNLEAQSLKIKFLANNGLKSSQTAEDKAELVLVPFSYKLDNYLLFLDKEDSFPASITLNSDLKLISASFQPFVLTFNQLEPVDSISIDRAIENIGNNSGLASIIYSEDSSFSQTYLDLLDNVLLSSVELEYRLNTGDNIASPYYRFYGTANDKNGVRLEIQVITPAVITK